MTSQHLDDDVIDIRCSCSTLEMAKKSLLDIRLIRFNHKGLRNSAAMGVQMTSVCFRRS